MTKTYSPPFPQNANAGEMNCIVSTAMTSTKAMDGTEAVGTAMALLFTAGADDARLDTITCRYTATNGSTATGTSAASVLRFWLNNGGANTTATNNKFIGEIAMPAQTVTALATGTMPEYTKVFGVSIPAGYRIYMGATVAAGGVLAFLGDANGGNY